jgi:hypothetical protein
VGAYLSRLLCKMYKEFHRLKYLLRTLFFSVMIISTYSIRITSAEKIELQHIIIGADKDTIDNFKKFSEITPIKKITTFNNPYTGYRAVVELVLIHQAIKLGGLETEIILKEMPNYARSVLQASHGKLDMPSETLWGLDIDETLFYKTDPIIRKYEQEMGIFVLPELNDTYKVNSLKDLQNLSAVVQKTWIMDVATLKDMKISRIEYPSTINSMYKMVEAKRVNFLLWTFSSISEVTGRWWLHAG